MLSKVDYQDRNDSFEWLFTCYRIKIRYLVFCIT